VDKELPLVTRLLKQAGCATVDGCHALDDDSARVDFRTAEDAMVFLNDMAAYGPERGPHTATVPSVGAASPFPERLYERITGCGSPGDWCYAVDPVGWPSEDVDEDGEESEDLDDVFGLGVSIRFPRADLPLIRERLARAVQDPRRQPGPDGHLDWWQTFLEEYDVGRLLLPLCAGAVGACLPRPGGRPDTASVTFRFAQDARAFLCPPEPLCLEGNHNRGSGPGAVGIDPRRMQTLWSRIIGANPGEGENWTFEARAIDYAVEERVVNGVIVQPRSKPEFDFAVTIRLPAADLPLLYEGLYEVAMDRERE
jgi:hypothetical protein